MPSYFKKEMKPIKISRSKIELFLDCPRCFWLEVKKKIKRPEKFTATHLGNKYDPFLKKVFDEYRRQNKKPKELEEFDFELYKDYQKLEIWRKKGVEYFHPEHKIIYYGEIDDLLIKENKYLIPFDFKTTLSKEFQVYESYKRQLEIYGYLLKKQGEEVLNLGVFYVVRVDINENFEKIEERKIVILENLNYEIYDEVLEKLKETYFSLQEPEPSENCPFCLRDFQIKNLYKNE